MRLRGADLLRAVVAVALTAAGLGLLQYDLNAWYYLWHPAETWRVPDFTLAVICSWGNAGFLIAAVWALLGLRAARGWRKLAPLMLVVCFGGLGLWWDWAQASNWIDEREFPSFSDVAAYPHSAILVVGFWMLWGSWRRSREVPAP